MMNYLKEFWNEEDGMGTVEIVLIVVVLVTIAIVFRTQITGMVDRIFTKINGDVDSNFQLEPANNE